MNETLAIVVFWILAAMAIFQSIFTFRFARLLKRACADTAKQSHQQNADYLPFVSIIISLRGADPGLRANISNMLQLDYPDYELRVIVDSENDPAWKVVSDVANMNQIESTCLR